MYRDVTELHEARQISPQFNMIDLSHNNKRKFGQKLPLLFVHCGLYNLINYIVKRYQLIKQKQKPQIHKLFKCFG